MLVQNDVIGFVQTFASQNLSGVTEERVFAILGASGRKEGARSLSCSRT